MLLSLSCLHNSNNNCINDVSSLKINVWVWLGVVINWTSLLVSLSWNEIDLQVLIGESLENSDCLLWLKLWSLLVSLIKDLLLWIAKIDQGWRKLSIWDGRVLFDLVVGESLILVEKEQNNGLVAVSH